MDGAPCCCAVARGKRDDEQPTGVCRLDNGAIGNLHFELAVGKVVVLLGPLQWQWQEVAPGQRRLLTERGKSSFPIPRATRTALASMFRRARMASTISRSEMASPTVCRR